MPYTVTNYQKTHRPVSRTEIKCDGKTAQGGTSCEKCGRFLNNNSPHAPNRTGSLGWVYVWANGTTLRTTEEVAI